MLPVQGPILVACLPVDEHQSPLTAGQNSTGCLPHISGQPAPGVCRVCAGPARLAWSRKRALLPRRRLWLRQGVLSAMRGRLGLYRDSADGLRAMKAGRGLHAASRPRSKR